jgi:hypothetical protein
MWGLFLGVSLAFILVFYEEWQQRRLNKKRLSEMRTKFKVGRHFDVTKGEWSDD